MATEFVRVYVPESDMDVTVARGLATSRGLKIIDKPPTDRYGRPLPAKAHHRLGSPKSPPKEEQADEATSNIEATKEATS